MKAKISLLPAIFILLVSMAMAVPLSVIDSQYVKFEPEFLEPAFSLIIQGDNSSDYVLFAYPESITGEVDDVPVQAQRGFKLTTTIEKESCDYSLTDNPRKRDIYKYDIQLEEDNVQFWQRDEFQESCNLKGSILNYLQREWIGPWPVYDVYCVYNNNKIATAGDVSNGQMNFRAKFVITKDDGTTLTETIASLAESIDGIPPIVSFEDNGETVAIIRWIGGSVTGEFCPDQDHVYAVQSSSNVWFTGNMDRYTEYNIQYLATQNLIDGYYDKLFDDPNYLLSNNEVSNLQTAVAQTNTRANSATEEEKITPDMKLSGARAIIELSRDHLIYKPQFQMFLKADWLQLIYLIGRPEIKDAGISQCIEGGVENDAFVTIENVGTALGKFIAGIKCESGIFITSTERSISLKPGESGTLTFPFSIDIPEDQRKSCVITVSDSTNPANMDKSAVSADCQATVFCSPEGITKCSGQSELVCKKGQWQATGSDNCKVTTCDRDDKCEPDRGESFEACGGKTASNNDCATCNFDESCDATETIYSCPVDCGTVPPVGIPTWVWIVGGSLLAIIGYGTYKRWPKKKKNRR